MPNKAGRVHRLPIVAMTNAIVPPSLGAPVGERSASTWDSPGITVPPNAMVKTFVLHGAVLDRAVCAVTHGEMGSTQKALARGVPVCVVPHGRDQFEVARRVEVSGSGTRLPAKRLTPARLKSKVLQAMSMVDGARRVADRFAATGGVGHGADLGERRLLGQPANRGPCHRVDSSSHE